MMKRALTIALIAAVSLCVSRPAAAQEIQKPEAELRTETLRAALSKKLVTLGLTPKEAESRVSQLTNQDIIQLTENPKQMGLGGIKDKTLIIIAVILILPSILLLAAL